MKFQFWTIGRVHEPYVKEGIEEFTKRIQNYFPVKWTIIPSPKNAGMMSEMDLRKKEGEMILDFLKKDDCLIVLDKRGKQFSNEDLAGFIRKKADTGEKMLVFLIGGAYGVSDEILQRASQLWSLSNLVFPHQLVRLILAEQIYRTCTILRNEKYHHG